MQADISLSIFKWVCVILVYVAVINSSQDNGYVKKVQLHKCHVKWKSPTIHTKTTYNAIKVFHIISVHETWSHITGKRTTECVLLGCLRSGAYIASFSSTNCKGVQIVGVWVGVSIVTKTQKYYHQ